MEPSNWLAFIARFGIAAYTLGIWLSLSLYNRESFLTSVLNSFGVGFPLPEKDYGDVCDIYVADHASGDPFFNITDRVDVFVLAHSLGWFVKALIVRDIRVSWVCSILFELIEQAFAHLLPNFNECWWDSWIFDVFGCNMLGIHLADLALTQLGWQKFDFFRNAFERRKSINFKFLFSATLLVSLISVIDLNFFFLKFVLWIPTTHALCHVRTYMFALLSAPASLELYNWSSLKNRKSFLLQCPSAVLGVVALLSEISLVVMFRGTMFAASPETPIGTILLVVTCLYATMYAFVKW